MVPFACDNGVEAHGRKYSIKFNKLIGNGIGTIQRFGYLDDSSLERGIKSSLHDLFQVNDSSKKIMDWTGSFF